MNWAKYKRNVSAFGCAESTDTNIRKIARALEVGAHIGGDIVRAKGRQEWLTRCYGYAFDLTGVKAEEAKAWWRRIREIGGIRLDTGKCIDPSLRSLQFQMRRDSPVLAG